MFKKKQKEENPKITRVNYTEIDLKDKYYGIKGKIGQKYLLYCLNLPCLFLDFKSQEIDELISLLQTIKEYESQELMKESVK